MHIVAKYCLYGALLLSACKLSAQEPKKFQAQKITITKACNYANKVSLGEITVIGGSAEGQTIVEEILKASPMMTKPVFTLNAGPVPNALATEQNGQRFIIYSEKFLEQFKAQSHTRWAAYGLLAHEIGHHVYRHSFGEKTREQSHQDELEADDFAARVMAHLNASLDDVLSGIRTFDKDGESDSHPGPEIREEVMTVAYKEEIIKVANMGDKKFNKFVLQLDPSCFANPWNLASEDNTQVELDDEKITIKIQIPSKFAAKRLKICLKTNDPNMTPAMRTAGAVSGTGVDLPYSPNVSIVWNYKMDRYGQDQISRPGMIRVYVYATDAQPKEAAGARFFWGTVGIAGLGATGYGLVQRSASKSDYETDYVPDAKRTGDANYAKAQEVYKDANSRYVRSQYIAVTGAVLATVGTILFIRAHKKTKEARRSICYEAPIWHLDPIIAADGIIGAGLRFKF